jgi:protoheme IX farnesyltransferase
MVSLLMLVIGGYCMVGASNAYNQVIEKDLDILMDRTKTDQFRRVECPRTAMIVATCY